MVRRQELMVQSQVRHSVVVEGLTSVLININKQYGSTHAGIRITGVQKKE